MRRAIGWVSENVIFFGILYMAIWYGGWWEYGVNAWIGFVAASIFILQIGSWASEILYAQTGKLKHAVSPINSFRLRGTPVPYVFYVGLEVALASLFISFGWYWLAAMQVYTVIGLMYIYDKELSAKALAILEARADELEGKTNAG